ncbi:hypothetical protein J6590_043050 [Homalodisca vitripennis]|nr:hypothetical protein J6590_043050 [Homalodisca vitripennis]
MVELNYMENGVTRTVKSKLHLIVTEVLQGLEVLSISVYIALNKTYNYCLAKNLLPNPSKTKQINFSRRSEQILALTDIDLIDHTFFALNCNVPRRGDNHEHYIRRANDCLAVLRPTLYTKKPSYAGARFLNLFPLKIKSGNQETTGQHACREVHLHYRRIFSIPA